MSFFNFSNAVTAAYFASEDLTILRANKNFATFFPILANVENVSFLDILDQLGVPKIQIEEFKISLKRKGQVIIPKVEITIEGTTKTAGSGTQHTKCRKGMHAQHDSPVQKLQTASKAMKGRAD